MINVTKIYLPDKEKYKSYIDKIYRSGWITNNGPLVNELQERLRRYLGVKNIILVSNGTIALEIAFRLLKLKGEVITTPFSFVATTTSILNTGLKPIFADIDSQTFNLDPKNIRDKITDQTSAIVPVHVFGNACEVENIEQIADKHNLRIIYDAAHAFGVNYKGKSILNHGEISTVSFHATKLFHTIEGGALIINDDRLVQDAEYLINFGMDSSGSVKTLGTNAKMNEFEAAMGLCVLDDIEQIIQKRKDIYEIYKLELKDLVKFQELNEDSIQNYSYFPIILKDEAQTLKIQKALNEQEIFPRRYFYPSLDTLRYIETKQFCKLSKNTASRILCLPIYPALSKTEQKQIINILKKIL